MPLAPTRCHRRPAAAGTLAVIAALALAATALAAAAVKGASYKGSFQGGTTPVTITFKVSSDGKRVTNLRASNAPLYCLGGGLTPVHFKDAAVSSKGAFKSTGVYKLAIGPRKGQIGTKLSITGTFKTGGRESGKVTTKYVGGPAKCSGHSNYSTKVVK